MTGAECLLQTLVDNDVDVCFMNPGTSEMQFVAALDREPRMRGILCLFEGVCSGAADGYARMTGRPAATLLHLGPGLANGLSNFHNAKKARSPVVSIVGEHSTQHMRHDAPLSADIHAFARTVSDVVLRPSNACELGSLAARAIAESRRPPGRVATLIIPADHSWSEAGERGPVIIPEPRRQPDTVRIREAAALIRSGANVGLLLGGSTLYERGLAAAGRTGARVFAHRNAARLQSGRGRYQPQRIAYFPEPAEAQLAGLEHLFLVEAPPPISFFGYPGRRSELEPPGCILHVLAREDEDGLAALTELVRGLPLERHEPEAPALPQDGPLTTDAVGRAVAALLPEHAILSDETISAGEAVWKHLLSAAPHDHMPVTGGSIGQGLPVALGAAIACPDRRVVALEADGSAMYTFQSLWTMARENLDVTAVIFANRRYRILDVEMERTGARGFGPRAEAMIDIGRPDIDFVKLARSLGVEASRSESAHAFVEQFADAMRTRGPRLIEALV